MQLLCAICNLNGQQSETQGWIFVTHKQQLSKRVDILADLQVRTADQLKYANTLLLRGAFSYNFSENHSAAVGFVYKGDREQGNDGYSYGDEHRLYEQYLYQFKILRVEMIARARLEQRWIKEEETKFSQRARTFLSAQIPVFTNKEFSKGIYAGLQNEIFMNVQNPNNVNNSFFDQNRVFVSVGYRWSKSVDTEIGYLYWRQKEAESNFNRHVIQLQISTNL